MAFHPVPVSHHQFLVGADRADDDYLELWAIGDDLLQVTGASGLTVLTGVEAGEVEVACEALGATPGDDLSDEDAAAETTIWCPAGAISVGGLFAGGPPELTTVPVGRPALLRVRVHAYDRRPGASTERYRIVVWPVDEELGFRSLRSDGLRQAGWVPDPGRAAVWALRQLVHRANTTPPERDLRGLSASGTEDDRVAIRRHRAMPALVSLSPPAAALGAAVEGGEMVLPVGDLQVRIRPDVVTEQRFSGVWWWSRSPEGALAAPDAAPSTVDLRLSGGELDLVHHGVRAQDAVLLGLVWDYLIAHLASGGGPTVHPWVPVFEEMATRAAAAEASRRRVAEDLEARAWGGSLPSPRLRQLGGRAMVLAQMDRPLLDAIDASPAQTQRAVAVWAAHQACAVAGLDVLGWVARALAALDAGDPLPPPFDDPVAMWERLAGDETVPRSTVTAPDGTPNVSQQYMALPAVPAAAEADPLLAAVVAVQTAALAFGDRRQEFLQAAHTLVATGRGG